MDNIKKNLEESKNKESNEEELKKEAFSKALKNLIEKKYDLSSDTVKNLLKLKLNLSSSEIKEMLEKSGELWEKSENLDIDKIEELQSDLDMLKKFKEEFIEDSEEEKTDDDNISEIFKENDGKIVKNLFSSSFVQSAKAWKILPWIIVWTTNSWEKIVKLWAWITIWFLTSFYDIYQIISGKGEYKRDI